MNHVKITSGSPYWQGSAVARLKCGAGRRTPSAPSSLNANKMRTMRRRNDVPAGRRLLVRGTAACPGPHRCKRMPLSELPACQDRRITEARRKKGSV